MVQEMYEALVASSGSTITFAALRMLCLPPQQEGEMTADAANQFNTVTHLPCHCVVLYRGCDNRC